MKPSKTHMAKTQILIVDVELGVGETMADLLETGVAIIFIDLHLASQNGPDLYVALWKITLASMAVLMSGMQAETEEVTVTVVHKPVDRESILVLLDKLMKLGAWWGARARARRLLGPLGTLFNQGHYANRFC